MLAVAGALEARPDGTGLEVELGRIEAVGCEGGVDRSRRIVESVTTAAEGLGVSPLAVALSWVRDQPGVAAAIVGARTHAQLKGVLQAEELTLPVEIRDALDDVSAVDP